MRLLWKGLGCVCKRKGVERVTCQSGFAQGPHKEGMVMALDRSSSYSVCNSPSAVFLSQINEHL